MILIYAWEVACILVGCEISDCVVEIAHNSLLRIPTLFVLLLG